MNISLTPQLEELVNEKVKSGLYTSASEVVRQALRFLAMWDEQQEVKLKALRSSIIEGLDSGEPSPLDFDDLRNEIKAYHKANNSK